MLKIVFIRTKVKHFLACLTLKVLNKFYKIIRIRSCTELWVFLVSEQMYQKAMGNDKEGRGRKCACSLGTAIVPPSYLGWTGVLSVRVYPASPASLAVSGREESEGL